MAEMRVREAENLNVILTYKSTLSKDTHLLSRTIDEYQTWYYKLVKDALKSTEVGKTKV